MSTARDQSTAMGVAALAFVAAMHGSLVLRSAAQTSTTAPGARTGLIVGQVVDGSSGAPVGEAIVQLALPSAGGNLPATRRVMTDGEGRFFFAELPAGNHYLEATKDGYTPGSYGQRQPWGQSRSVTLGDGEKRTDIVLRVWKHAVIGGTVVDEVGEPVVGIAVRALVKHVVAGRTRYGNEQVIDELVPTAVTDDRGMFRLSRLTPATYVVLVPSTHATVPASFLEKLDTTVRNDLFRAGVHEIAPPGQPRTLNLGEFALLTLNRVLIPPPPSPSGRMQTYRTTYYPNSPMAAAATPLTVKSGEERTDLTITMRPVSAVSVAGRVVTPDGSTAPPMTIRLVGEAMTDVLARISSSGPSHVGLDAATGVTDGSGRFMLHGVPAGDYVLRQANPFMIATVRQGRPAYWLTHQVAVGREDVRDLVVELRPALRLEGRIVLRPADERQPARPLRLAGVMFATPYGDPGQVAAEVDRDSLTFATVAAGGQYILRPYESGGWFVESVTLDGKDITDRVFDLQADATSFVVTYTDRPTPVSGRVTNAKGEASDTAVVLAFPVDHQRWSGHSSSFRLLKSALTSRDGVYTFDHLPPGEYYVAAVGQTEIDGWQDPARLEVLSRTAERLSIAAGDSLKTLNLRLASGQ